jgi:hypothetical protein
MPARTLAVALIVGIVAVPAGAQPPTAGPSPSTSRGPGGMAELRLGGLWPQALLVSDGPDAGPSSSRFSAGARFGLTFPEPFGGRLSLQFIVDYSSLGSSKSADGQLGLVKREGHWFVFTPAISVDLLKTSTLAVGVRAGPSVVGELTTFLLENTLPSCSYSPYGSICDDQFENVCDLKAFEDRCTGTYRAALALGTGVRWHPVRAWPMYFGLDYTWLSSDKHLLVGTIGVWTRY